MDMSMMPYDSVEASKLTELRDQGTKVGSGGFVKLVDFMGSDEKIVRTARLSTGRGFVSWDPYMRCKKCDYILITLPKDPPGRIESLPSTGVRCKGDEHKWENFPNGDKGIIHNLVRERHTSPIEFGKIVFHLRIPMHIWRQVVRHRMANVSEYSTRYSEAIDEMETTKPDEWRYQATLNRQGSSGCMDSVKGNILSTDEATFHRLARDLYENRLRFGVAKEQARKDLPLSNYTEVFWCMDLHNLMHFLGLRLEEHAQKEAREFGAGIATIVKFLFPRLYWAFEEFKLHAVTFSRTEMAILQDLLLGHDYGAHVFHKFDEVGHPFHDPKNKAGRDRFLKKFGVK